ncbi:MAG: exo-alpha-sialidase, partial [Candidatus Latescibacteria bacterium]|nr:exo-alpha-sialidase [Candidatus Latescibacterota bacterium]
MDSQTIYNIGQLETQIEAPVHVGGAPGHHWFPMLHSLSDSEKLCMVTVSDDRVQGEWPGRIYHTNDGGSSWNDIGDMENVSHASVSINEQRLLVLPYELFPANPNDFRNACANGTMLDRPNHSRIVSSVERVCFHGFSRDFTTHPGGQLKLATNGNVLTLENGQLFTTLYGVYAPETRYTCVSAVSDDMGCNWNYRGTVASWSQFPDASDGPCESNTVQLSDGRLLCIFRVGSGRNHPFGKCYSNDAGVSWTRAETIGPAWSVQPKLLLLANGVLLLAGGRPGLFLWLCADGSGLKWDPINLAQHHNECCSNVSHHFTQEFCSADTGAPAQSTAYTGLMATGPDEALLCYDRLG